MNDDDKRYIIIAKHRRTGEVLRGPTYTSYNRTQVELAIASLESMMGQYYEYWMEALGEEQPVGEES
jgi:hypothetical protein